MLGFRPLSVLHNWHFDWWAGSAVTKAKRFFAPRALPGRTRRTLSWCARPSAAGPVICSPGSLFHPRLLPRFPLWSYILTPTQRLEKKKAH